MIIAKDLNKIIEETRNGIAQVGKELKLHNVIMGIKPQTMRMVETVKKVFNDIGDDLFKPGASNKVPENRLSRVLGLFETELETIKEILLNDGRKLKCNCFKTTYSVGDSNPMYLYVELAAEPVSWDEDPISHKKWESAKKQLKKGIEFNDVHYEYCVSSAAQQRTLKGVFVRSDYKISEELIVKFQNEEYRTLLRSFIGAEAILELITYGGYSLEFRGKSKSASKAMTRFGAALTATKSLGNNFNARLIGKAQVKWTSDIQNALEKHLIGIYGDNQAKVDSIIDTYEKHWKEDKFDGCSLIRLSSLHKSLEEEIGVKIDPKTLIGELLQARYAGFKGTFFVMPDELLDACKWADGTHAYVGFDLIIEENSWKYNYRNNDWVNELAPDLEMVRISKARASSSMNYQFFAALDGVEENLFNNTDSLINKMIDGIKGCLEDPTRAKYKLGMIDTNNQDTGMLDIDQYTTTLISKTTKALDASDDVVKDKWWRKKLLNNFIRVKSRGAYGKVSVEGANRYLVTDPVIMLRTDLSVATDKVCPFSGLAIYDIVITKTDELGLKGVNDCYWNNHNTKAVLFRSPLVHPGEPCLVDLLENKRLPIVKTSYGEINVAELYSNITKLCVINAFSLILEAMGGASHAYWLTIQ